MNEQVLSSKYIKAEALRLGFDLCGIAAAGSVDSRVTAFMRQWLQRHKNADMKYLENYFDKRCNPTLLTDHVQTIVSVALNYFPTRTIPTDEYQIAWYAYGKDYHEVIKNKLNELLSALQARTPDIEGRAFCDTAPLLERYWAQQAGLGWIGKNTMLTTTQGNCFFLGELLINHRADEYDTPQPDRCGTCHRCIDVCPTQALEAPYDLNASKCINYLTIENKNDISAEMGQKMGNSIYGCMRCQTICPWNKFAKPCTSSELQPSDTLLKMQKTDWDTLDEKKYQEVTRHSAIKRAKFSGLKRNIDIARRNGEET